MTKEGAYIINENIKKSLDYLIEKEEFEAWRQLIAKIKTLMVYTKIKHRPN